MNPVYRLLGWLLQPFVLSLFVLVAAWFLASRASAIPPSFSGLWEYGPYVALGILGVMGLVYRMGRVVLAALLFGAGLVLILLPEVLGAPDQQILRALTLTVLIPANLALAGWYRERGVLTDFGIMRFTLLLAQFGALCWGWYASPEAFNNAFRHLDIPAVARHLGPAWVYPQLGYATMLVSTGVLAWCAIRQRSHFAYTLLAAYLGYVVSVVAAHHVDEVRSVDIALGLILCIAILRDAYNMAYRDELTGLPQRRALTELCLALSGNYTLAMMDVDHFKQFNDTYGHDTGDDVLKMVASRIARVRDGGRAFRYGGEEFTVVYPSKVKEQALRSLEAVRESIEAYEMVVRPPRQKVGEDDTGKVNRGKGKTAANKRVSVTISIGVADREERGDTPDAVLKRADEALYAAKRSGRNRVVAWSETLDKAKKKSR